MSKESSFLVSSTGTCKTQETENKIDSPKGNPLLISISVTLMDVISNNHLKEHYKHKLKSQSKHIFTSKTVPKISFGDYITRVLNYTQITTSYKSHIMPCAQCGNHSVEQLMCVI